MICIVDCSTSGSQKIKQHLSDLHFKFKMIKPDEAESFDFQSCAGIIVSGGTTVLSQANRQEYLSLFGFLNSVEVPVLGICLGHQVLGLLHGSTIGRSKKIEKMERITIVNENDLFRGIPDLAEFREEHEEFISLPEDFVLLAQSESCDNESMKHRDKPLYGVQFHPEKSDAVGKILFSNFLKLCR